MKLIRIGSGSNCDIVINSDYVSTLHAELTLLDNGKIFIEDKSSRNGTTVGNKKLEPGKEIMVQRGERVVLGDARLPWNEVPVLEKLSAYKTVKHIGSNHRNDIVVAVRGVSRFHASLRVKGGKCFIHDNASTNGTFVNGERVKPDCDVRIQRGDIVVCGTEDVTHLIKDFIPANKGKIAAIAAGSVAALAIVAVVLLKVVGLFGASASADELVPAVAMVHTGFHIEVSFEDDPLQLGLKMPVYFDNEERTPFFGSATAFFIDDKGHLASNKHVAQPWEEFLKSECTEGVTWEEKLKEKFEEYWQDQLLVDRLSSTDYLDFNQAILALESTEVGKALLSQCDSVSQLNAKLNMLRKSKVKVKGVLDFIGLAYAGHNVQSVSDLDRCAVVCSAKEDDVDLSILQLNSKRTPDFVTKYFDINNCYETTLVPLQDELSVIGYPAGLGWNLDEKKRELQPMLRTTQCSQAPSKYDFAIQDPTVGGSSGSPVFNKKGQLVGILYGTYQAVASRAVQVKFLKKLYDEEVKFYQ
ncbi:MAG: FHA domain-containing protein [Bacteroidales bacterium]|nr:FHA domain-containing protein [Bacteroidales bacterium]